MTHTYISYLNRNMLHTQLISKILFPQKITWISLIMYTMLKADKIKKSTESKIMQIIWNCLLRVVHNDMFLFSVERINDGNCRVIDYFSITECFQVSD